MALSWLAPDGGIGRAPRALKTCQRHAAPRVPLSLAAACSSAQFGLYDDNDNDVCVRFRRSIGLPFRRSRVVCRSGILVADAICRPRKRSGVGEPAAQSAASGSCAVAAVAFSAAFFRRCACQATLSCSTTSNQVLLIRCPCGEGDHGPRPSCHPKEVHFQVWVVGIKLTRSYKCDSTTSELCEGSTQVARK